MGNDKFDLRDFSLIKTATNEYVKNLKLLEEQDGFYHLVLGSLEEFELSDEEISDSITDTNYILNSGGLGGHDRGIDAIIIQQEGKRYTINFFNFKYKSDFEHCSRFYPSGEIDKISSFLDALFQKKEEFFDNSNPLLKDKVKEVWTILSSSETPRMNFYLCTNGSNEIESSENERLKREMRSKNISLKYVLGQDVVNSLNRGDKVKIDANLKFIGKEYFEKSDGDIKAVIANIDSRDLIRIVLDNESLRESASIQNYEDMKGVEILGKAFEENVRIYQQQRGKINQNIKSTALSESKSKRFFYFNNGITITCDKISYPPGVNSPVVSIENLQIVNGCQTIYSLYDAFQEDPSKFEDINILCKIYETKNKRLSINIAEYTNSQNPVNNRDIRSVDHTQITLETELLKKGYFYERKKNMYKGKPLEKKIDSEKAGQLIMSFYNNLPGEAKNKKAQIFDKLYEEVFSPSINAESIILINWLYNQIELKKKKWKEGALRSPEKNYELDSFIMHSSFYILYVLKLMTTKSIPPSLENKDTILAYYDDAYNLIKSIVKRHLNEENYSHGDLFKKSKLKSEILKELNSQ